MCNLFLGMKTPLPTLCNGYLIMKNITNQNNHLKVFNFRLKMVVLFNCTVIPHNKVLNLSGQ